MPQQHTTFSQAIVPWSVSTPVTRPSLTTNPVTTVCRCIRAPCIRAPLASDWVMSDGLACPSLGMNEPPARSEVSIGGHMRLISSGESKCISRPKLCAVVAWRLNSIMRSGRRPAANRRTLPAGRKPGLGLKPGVKLDRVAQELGDRGGRPELADEARGMPGRAGGQPVALEHDDIRLVVAGQMIGRRTADDAAADHHILSLRGKCFGHRALPNSLSNISRLVSNRSWFSVVYST